MEDIIIKKEKDESIESSIFIGATTVSTNTPNTHIENAQCTNEYMRKNRNSYNQLDNNLCSTSGGEYKNRMTNKPIAGSLCGEVYVMDNARKWTFVCTYCNKATWDIGEFVCHITLEHMGGGGQIADAEKDYNERNFIGQDQEYFDCGSYLDVNVQVENDVLTGGISAQKDRHKLLTESSERREVKSTITKDNFVINFLANENNDNAHDDDENSSKWGKQDSIGDDYDYDNDDDALEESLQIKEDPDDKSLVGNDYLDDGDDDDDESDDSEDGSTVSTSKHKRKRQRNSVHCSICNKTFPFYSLYRYHMVKHTNQSPFLCPMCKRGFKSKQSLSYHKKTHFRENLYKCQMSMCSFECSTKNALLSHMSTHESTYPCHLCGKVFDTVAEKEMHLKTLHVKDLPFKCDFCEKRFVQQHHLEQHLRLHRQYYCEFCKVEFSTAKTASRPYACPTCEMSPKIQKTIQSQRDALKDTKEDVYPLGLYENTQLAHLHTTDNYFEDNAPMASRLPLGLNSKGKPRVPCKYCPRTYTHTSALNYHIRQKHPEFWKLYNT